VCALFVGGYHITYKLALASGGRAEATVALSLSVASVINVVACIHGRGGALAIQALRAQPGRAIVCGVLANVGFLLFLIAMRDAGAGLVLTLRNTSILFAQMFAIVLGERPGRLGIVGAALVTAGAVLLAL
jgi:uncharacterized membrane protein